MTTRANLYVDQGVDYFISLELQTDDREDYPIDSEKQFFCQVRKVYSSKVDFQVELDVVVNGVTNLIELYIPPERTENIKSGKYQYDIIMIRSGGIRQKILEGTLFILPTITNLE
jgi:hypothetical protein